MWTSHHGAFSYFGAQARVRGLRLLPHVGSVVALLGSRAQAQQWLVGLVAPQLVESSWIRDRICDWQVDSLPLSHQGSP